MRLVHIHLPSCSRSVVSPSPLYPPYTIASRIQERLRRRQLDFKDRHDDVTIPPTPTPTIPSGTPKIGSSNNAQQQQPPTGVTQPQPPPPPPPPTLLSFTPLPTYTLGRRQTAPLSPAEVARLLAPLHQWTRTRTSNDDTTTQPQPLPVTILPSPRGGLTTYHGPGQIVLWPILDLRSPYHKTFTVRCYSRLLEDTTISTLASVSASALAPFTTADPGVWVRSPGSGGEPAKIAALGVHLRRHISALGTAINVDMPGPEVGDEGVNPWARIVACGLEGKGVTSLVRELGSGSGSGGLGEEEVASAWAGELARRIGVDGVEAMGREDVLGLVEEVVLGGEDGHGHGEVVATTQTQTQTQTHGGGGGDGDGDGDMRRWERAYLEGIRELWGSGGR